MSLIYNNKAIDLSIIIINWNSWNDLNNCILSILANTGELNYEIIVVDNYSTDQSVNNIKKYFPDIILIINDKNIGFPAANNQAFKIAKGEYLLALNPDTLIKNEVLKKSISELKNDNTIGCLGVKTLKGDGEILLSCARSLPTLWSTFCHILYIDTIFKKWKFHQSSEMAYWDHNNSCEIDLLHGGYMMFPAFIYKKLGGFDDKIAMFYEDIEFCCRVKKYGYRNYYLANVEIVHLVGKSISQAKPKWITGLYCDANYLYFLEYGGGNKIANFYVLMILLITPIRILYSPFIWLGYLLLKRKIKKFSLINLQIYASFIWAINKLYFNIKNYLNKFF